MQALEEWIHSNLMRSRYEWVAILHAVLLSTACLLRGAVDDGVVATLLITYLPLLLLISNRASGAHLQLRACGIVCFGGILLILLMQQISIATSTEPFWQAVHSITGTTPRHTLAADKAGWIRSFSRLMLLTACFTTALVIGMSEACSRLFLQTLLISGTILIAFTFFSATNEGIPTNPYYAYSHGFVNANNAAAYFGLMLMLGLAETTRFFRLPSKLSHHRYFLELLDRINVMMILKGGFLVFAILITFAGLLMTGSRAGILLSAFCSAVLLVIILSKFDLGTRTRKQVMMLCTVGLGFIMLWAFFNFGAVISGKLQWNGVDSNSRLDIYKAILPMITKHPLFGTGLGSFSSVFQLYRPTTLSPDGIIDKAHNSYLEFAVEMGIPCLVLLLFVLLRIGIMLTQGIRVRKERYITPTLGFSILLFAALFSLVDFPLQIPALAALFLSVVIIGASQTERRFSEPATHSNTRKQRVRVRKRRDPVTT